MVRFHVNGLNTMNRPLNFIFIITLLFSIGTSTVGIASEVILTSEHDGTVNWTRATIQATGRSNISERHNDDGKAREPLASAAVRRARKNLMGILEGIRIDTRMTIGDIINAEPSVKAEIVRMVSTLEPINGIRHLPGNIIEVTLQLAFRGRLSRLVLPKEIRQIKPIKPIAPTNKAVSNTSGAPYQSKAIFHTGLIVNAKGLKNLKPVLVPSIVDESGREVYGPAFVSREFAVLSGVSGYTRDLASAKDNPRVRYHPLIIKGLKTHPIDGAMIVVSDADASKLRAASENLSFLRKCRVIIVLD